MLMFPGGGKPLVKVPRYARRGYRAGGKASPACNPTLHRFLAPQQPPQTPNCAFTAPRAAAMARWLAPLLLLAALAAPGHALTTVVPFCEASLTRPKVLGCTECLAAAGQCYSCSARLSAIWKGPKLTEVGRGRALTQLELKYRRSTAPPSPHVPAPHALAQHVPAGRGFCA